MSQRQPSERTDDDLYRDWLGWIQRAYDEAIGQGWRHRMFRLIRGIYEQNPELQQRGGFVVAWMAQNYVVAAAMALRRELDGQSGAENLFHLLYEIRDRPSVLSRARFRATWGESPDGPYTADTAFDQLRLVRHANDHDRDHIDPEMINEDLAVLDAQDRVIEHIQTTIAHRMPARPDEGMPTFGEFHAAADVVATVFKRYYTLLTHRTLVTTEPSAQFNTFAPFRSAWIPDAERFDYERCR